MLFVFPLFSRDYYWVGGSGNWSDISHWATTSGGSVKHNKAPTAEDNVFFDANSFSSPGQTVDIRADNAFCRNMTWRGAAGNPELTADGNKILNIYGSLILIPDMKFSFRGTVNFLGREESQPVDLAGHVLAGAVAFEGEGGGWVLRAPLQTAGVLRLVNGVLSTGGQPVSCLQLRVEIAGQGELRLDTSRVEVKGSNPSVLLKTAGLTIDAANATFTLTHQKADFTVEGNDAAAINRLEFTHPTGQARLKVSEATAAAFDELRFAGNADLYGLLNTGTLRLAPGRFYTFQSGMTYKVGQLDAPGECVAPITMFSSLSGSPATLLCESGGISLEYVALKDLHAAGGASFRADNSADLGNNQGWQINARPDNNLYWVGGAGSWDDPTHWSFSSGGPGGACIPTGADNVIFDANSFDGPGAIVTVNIQNAFCRDMTWTGAGGRPILAGELDRNLRIYGSLRLIENMEYQFLGDVHFESPRTGNTIATANQPLHQDVIFDGFGGGWTLNDSLTVAEIVYFRQGDLQTAGKPLACARFVSTDPLPRRLDLGSSHLTLRFLGTGFSIWELNVANLEFDAGTSLLEFFGHGQITHKGSGAANYHRVVFNEVGFMDTGKNDGMSIASLLFRQSGTIVHSWKIDTIELTRGYEYRLDVDNFVTIEHLIARGTCNANISIRSYIDDVPANLRSDRDNGGDYLILKDIHTHGSGRFTANQSFDLGNNDGWTINNRTGRTLYWVGGAGDWEDSDHWSLSSGGPGGECIPTPVDDVIFDAASFDAAGQTVRGWGVIDHFCRDMTWRDPRFEPTLDMATLQIFGSLDLAQAMTVKINELRLRSEETGRTIHSRRQAVGNLIVEGSGSWQLEDPLVSTGQLTMLNGRLITNDQDLACQRFVASLEETPKALELGRSQISVAGPGDRNFSWDVEENADFSLQAGESIIELTHPSGSMRNQIPLAFHDVRFTAPTGESRLAAPGGENGSTYRRVQFNKDGVITGKNVFDTLLFSPGKAYQLEADRTQTVNHFWRIFGNNCQPIKLSSTKPGRASRVHMPQGAVNGDFIQMRDQQTSGDATFFAGMHSTDIARSNTGWVFESAPAFVEVGFLGTDLVLCNDQSLVLDANNNSANENYRWHDGATGPTYDVDRPGTYWVEVSFGERCQIRDSVVVLPPEAFNVPLMPDTVLCDGERIVLDATFPAVGVAYRWQDGSEQPRLEVSGPGEYSVELSLTGCTDADSVRVDYVTPPVIDLGQDRTLCHQSELELNAAHEEATAYRWQDSTVSPSFLVRRPGTYWVEVLNGSCAGRDSIVIDYFPAIEPDLGPDTTLCEREVLTLQWPKSGVSFRWSDGSATEALRVDRAGDYWVDVTRDGCTERDSIQVNFKPLPAVDLGEDLILCAGETATIDGTSGNGADKYFWSDSTQATQLRVNAAGDYWLEASLDGCSYRDSVNVRFVVIPGTELGRDTVLCEGEVLALDIALPDATYEWQDGAIAPRYVIRAEGLYWGEVRVGQCSDRDSILVTYKPRPRIEIGRDTLLCEGDPYSMTLETNGEEYAWFDGSTASGFAVTDPGMYWAEARLNGCVARDTAIIEFQARLPLELGADTTICHDQQYRLDPLVRGESYRWQDGSDQATYLVKQAGVYTVEILDGQCMLRDTVTVLQEECTYFTYYIPNAFSPDNDGVNDLLQVNFPPDVEVLQFQVSIFDRWGNQLFQSADPDMAWDGNYRSRALPTGIYVYVIELEYRDDRRQDTETITGDVLLVR